MRSRFDTKREFRSPSVRWIVSCVAVAGAALAGCAAPEMEVVEAEVEAEAAPSYEVWALDQGTNRVHVFGPTGDPESPVAELDVLDLGALGVDMPHMIDFTSDYGYAFIANVQSGDVTVVRADDREVVANLETGHMSHMAKVHPGDDRILVDVMHGEGAMVEIVPDWENETFALGRRLVVADDPVFQEKAEEFAGSSPVCHENTSDGRYAFITLGPPLSAGGLLVMDVEAFELVAAHPISEVSVNCGTLLSADGGKIYMNGGSMEDGHWYVFDAASHEPIPDAAGEIQRSSRGLDAHGVWITPDGGHLWMVNRATSNAIVIDTATDEVVAEIDHVGPSPDLVTFSPDGRYAFVTLRGPNPRSGPHAIAGTTPGLSILDVETREIVAVIEPDPGNEDSDFHGLAMRPVTLAMAAR